MTRSPGDDFRHRMARLAWFWVWLLFFRLTPRWSMNGWRRFLLRAFGARIGIGAVVRPSCRIWAPWNLTMGPLACIADDVDCYCTAPITLGSKVTVSQKSLLYTVACNLDDPGRSLDAEPIVIEDFAWVAAGGFVGPGVRVGRGAVVGAYGVVTADVAPWHIIGGNPARFIRLRKHDTWQVDAIASSQATVAAQPRALNDFKSFLRHHRITLWLYPYLARSFFLLNQPRKRRLLHANGWAILSRIQSTLDQAGVLYFLDFGTLLGMVREGGFLGHDSDIDIGVIEDRIGMSDHVRKHLLSAGFTLVMAYVYKGKNVQESYLCEHVKVDICYYVNDAASSQCWLFYSNPRKQQVYPSANSASVYAFRYRKITEVTTIRAHNGTALKVPCGFEDLLVEKYGPGWRTPDKNWKYWLAPGATECPELGNIERL